MASVAELIAKVKAADRTGATEITALVKENGAAYLEVDGLLSHIKGCAEDKTSPASREGALVVIKELCSVGVNVEPFVVPTLPIVLELAADKAPAVRTAAEEAGSALMSLLSPFAINVILQQLFDGMEGKRLWQTKVLSLKLLASLTKTAPAQISKCLPYIVPVVSHTISDAKPQVKEAGIACLTETCKVVGNRDIEPFVPTLIGCIARPAEVPNCIHKLAATTFVQAVEAPTLAIMIPLLVRGLRERVTAVKRKTAVIIDNMAKLVDNPADAEVFLPRLLPGLARVAQDVADPECRNVATKAEQTLQNLVTDKAKAAENSANEDASAELVKADEKEVLKTLKEVLASVKKAEVDATALAALEYVAGMCAFLIGVRDFDIEHWTECVTPYLSIFLAADVAEDVCKAFLARCVEDVREKDVVVEDEEEGVELCNCEFSLAYGGKILLNNATLKLKKGKRYGLCGPNGAGKSTLMRAIANGQLDGFPPKEELRTVYVEHDIDSELADTPVVDYIFLDPALEGENREEVVRVLSSVGFTDEMQAAPVASLSGGWKMKLALARAMLMRAQIMLLDEPTNHLDVNNVAWLENYLIGLKDVTSILVSHDSGFLDNVCTDIIHYESRKLKLYKGNLSEFVKVRPEARSYYELEASTLKFILPEPGFLEGVKTKDRAILKMHKAGFTYPGTTRKIVSDVTIQCNLNSRVAVIGANGAGKSTMIKLLTGELEPQDGTIWKHPNLRVAYVAQHAFHHIEQHLDETPNQYIQWRYAIGEDREGLEKVDRKVTEEEEKAMAAKQNINGEKRVVEKLLGRRKLKKSYEYEVQWVGCHPDQNTWLTRDKLEDMGFSKLVNEVDVKEAARLGLHQKPLTTAVVQKHLEALGIDPEFGTHSQIRGLSGGQKVKVVLAAAMWLNPHMLILDEPTNYLDRDSLGALAAAIKDYGGGVIMISHNREFTSALCPETWTVADGKVHIKGQSEAVMNAQKLELKRQEEMTDAFGNTVKIKQPEKKLSRQELKKKQKAKEARRKRGEVVTDSDEE